MEGEISTLLDRCREGEGRYAPCRFGAYRGFVRKDADPGWLIESCYAAGARQIKRRPKTRIFANRGMFFKFNLHPSLWRVIRQGFRLPRPFRSLAAALRLEELGVSCPEVIMAVRKRRFLNFPVCDLLITRELSSDRIFLDTLFTDRTTGKDVSELLKKLVSFLKILHEGGFEHGDLNLRNIYCLLGASGELLKFGLIDLDGCRLYPEPLPESRRRREGARVVSSLMKSLRLKAPELRVRTSDVVREFCFYYQEQTGIDLAGEEMNERVTYLLRRKRKDN